MCAVKDRENQREREREKNALLLRSNLAEGDPSRLNEAIRSDCCSSAERLEMMMCIQDVSSIPYFWSGN